MQNLSDDLVTLHWRTNGGQAAPVIIRTRGHRLEGIWHSGSSMGMILGALRGIYLCFSRNMTQAAGFYNTLLKSHDPALVIEPLNSYQLKEKLPSNIGEFTIPLGVPEVLEEGIDILITPYLYVSILPSQAFCFFQQGGLRFPNRRVRIYVQ